MRIGLRRSRWRRVILAGTLVPLGPHDDEHLITFHPRPCFYFPDVY
jgi:hypothetical protein